MSQTSNDGVCFPCPPWETLRLSFSKTPFTVSRVLHTLLFLPFCMLAKETIKTWRRLKNARCDFYFSVLLREHHCFFRRDLNQKRKTFLIPHSSMRLQVCPASAISKVLIRHCQAFLLGSMIHLLGQAGYLGLLTLTGLLWGLHRCFLNCGHCLFSGLFGHALCCKPDADGGWWQAWHQRQCSGKGSVSSWYPLERPSTLASHNTAPCCSHSSSLQSKFCNSRGLCSRGWGCMR